jgi:hypothetical protein
MCGVDRVAGCRLAACGEFGFATSEEWSGAESGEQFLRNAQLLYCVPAFAAAAEKPSVRRVSHRRLQRVSGAGTEPERLEERCSRLRRTTSGGFELAAYAGQGRLP